MTAGERMRAAVLVDAGRVEIREIPRPIPGPREILLRPRAVGLCGTDFHVFSGEANYHLDDRGAPIPLARSPQILGHEIAGVVEETGEAVVVDQGRHCGSEGREARCEYCATGDSHQCERYAEHGISGLPGALAEFLAVPATNALRIETGLDFALAAMTEPLACVLHAFDLLERTNARYRLGNRDPASAVRSVLVCGAGPSGLLFVQVLRRVLRWEGLLLASEPDPHRRALAASFGATTIDPSSDDLAEAISTHTGGRRVELFFESSGSGPLFESLPGLIRKQATVVLYGHGHGGVGLEALNAVQWREPTIVSPIGASGGFDEDGRPSVYRRALRLLEEGTIDARSLVTHRYRGLDAVPPALASAGRDPGYVKGVVVFDAAATAGGPDRASPIVRSP